MSQPHERRCFHPVSLEELMPQEKKRAMDAFMFLVKKRDSCMKSRACANGSVQQGWMNREESTSPTAALESVMITGAINTHDKRDIATADAPNTFAQTHVKCKPGNE